MLSCSRPKLVDEDLYIASTGAYLCCADKVLYLLPAWNAGVLLAQKGVCLVKRQVDLSY